MVDLAIHQCQSCDDNLLLDLSIRTSIMGDCLAVYALNGLGITFIVGQSGRCSAVSY
ncbi:hypothetical protein [Moraxella sp.]|uniref:hypothetical protein n=1 Tax=Moraxella sp. TaxID=479 RepID=UPI0026DBFEEC|nr:hypothetical protein [Moraxella sp.]MDO4895505.1 hypothetical protein [Moraxella sp.]